MAEPFIPTLKWHIKVLAVLLVLCTAAFFIVSYAMAKLPAPDRPQQPAAETTPWLH